MVAANIYNKLLLERKRSHLDPLLWINQNGFRPGGSTAAQIVTLRRLIEGVKAKQLQSVITFVDFKKAFEGFDSLREVNEDTISVWSAKEDSRCNKYPLKGPRGTSEYTRRRDRLL